VEDLDGDDLGLDIESWDKVLIKEDDDLMYSGLQNRLNVLQVWIHWSVAK
jgi:hypothetical protein